MTDANSNGPITMPAQLAQIHEQIKNLAVVIREVKESVSEIAALDRTLAQLAIRHEQTDKEVTTQWTKINGCAIEIGVVADRITKHVLLVDSKTDEWINKARGAYWTAMLLGSFAQSIIIGAIMWNFTHLRAVEDDMVLVKYRMGELEKVLPKPAS